ncbi:gas vesicle protein GvpO [Streptomyces griseoaurantiacus]
MSNTSHASNSRDSSERTSRSEKSDEAEEAEEARGSTRRKAMTPMEVVRKGSAQFVELTGLEAESVSSFARTDDGWSLEIEVLELSRVPDTMSLLASYEVELTAEGDLAGYRRVRRYERGRSDRRSGG